MSDNEDEKKRSPAWSPLIYVLLGGAITLVGTVITELWLVPSREMRIQANKQREYRLTKLYNPLMILTAHGKRGIGTSAVFYKTHIIMLEYGFVIMALYSDKQLLCLTYI